MKVLVTGSNGFSGQFMLPFLRSKGCEAAGLAREKGVNATYVADLLDKPAVLKVLNDFQPEVILHLAGIALPGYPDIEQMYQINLFACKNLLDAVLESGINLKRFIAASSAHVYGLVDASPVKEEHTTIPASHYGNSKLGMENICRLYMDKLPVVITRPFNYSGHGQSTDYVLAKIIAHFCQNAREITLGNIDVVRDFSYIDDVLAYYWSLMLHEDSGYVVNLCSAQGHSLRDLILFMNKIAGYEIKVNASNSLLRPQDNPVFIGDNSRLRTIIGDYPALDCQQMLTQLFQKGKL